MGNTFKPMLAIQWNKSCKFPKLASNKLDGIRAIMKNGDLLSRSFKPIRNIRLVEKYRNVLNFVKDNNLILDGEFYSHTRTFQEITSIVNSSDKEVPSDIKYHVFDLVKDNDFEKPFNLRYMDYKLMLKDFPEIVMVKQSKVKSLIEINLLFEEVIKNGYEGLILRDLLGRYKFGRSTLKEELMLKVKPFETFDAKILGVIERNENLNESETNELGRSFKRNTKADKRKTGIASAFVVAYKEHTLKVTLTGIESFRREIWENQDNYIGKMIEYKAMIIGSKNVPRHPNFVRFRQDKD